MTLFELSANDRLVSQLLEENGGELTPEIESLLEETKELFPKKIDGYGVMLRKFKALEEACDSEIKRIQGIKKTAQNSQKNMRKHIQDTMDLFGYKKLVGNMTMMWISTSNSLEVDEDALLSQYTAKIEALNKALPPYLSVEVKVSKTALKNEFKGADVLPAGCTIKESESLTIK